MAESVYYRILQASAARIESLKLEGLTGGVKVMMMPNEKNIRFPCVLVTVDSEAETIIQGTNRGNVFGYPVRLTINDRNDSDYTRPLSKYLLWRETLMLHFLRFEEHPFTDVTEARGCEVTPEVIVDPKLPAYQYFVSGMLLRFTTAIPKT